MGLKPSGEGLNTMSRTFGYVQYKPSRAHATRIIASYPTPPHLFADHPDLKARISKTFRVDQEAEARAWLRRQQLLHETGTWQPEQANTPDSPNSITFAQYWPIWFANRRTPQGTPLRPQTRYRMEKDCLNHLMPRFGHMRLRDIDHTAITSWLDSLPADQPAMRANALKLLRAILRTATQRGPHGEPPLIDHMPYDTPQHKPTKRHETIPATPEQVHSIYMALPEKYRLSVYLSVFCRGLRISEVVALQRQHIDLDRHILHVRQARQHMGATAGMVGDVKTDGSRRDERIPDVLIPLIRQHLQTIPDEPDAWLFPSAHSNLKPLSAGTLRKAYDKARREAGRPDLWFHDLRHTALTWLAQDGATLRELMDSAGHTTTENALRYQHAVHSRDEELATKLGERLIGDDTATVQARLDTVEARIAQLEDLRRSLQDHLNAEQ